MCRVCAHSQLTPSRREGHHGHRHSLGAGDRPQKAPKGKKDRQLRADLFDLPANTGKAQAVFDLWALWRRGLHAEVLVAREDLARGDPLRAVILAPAEAREPAIAASKARVGAQEQQMIRGQATAAVASWLTAHQTEMRDAIERRDQPRVWKEGQAAVRGGPWSLAHGPGRHVRHAPPRAPRHQRPEGLDGA